MHQEIVLAEVADHLLAAIPGDLFGAAVPEKNPPVPVDNVQTVGEILQDRFVMFGIQGYLHFRQ